MGGAVAILGVLDQLEGFGYPRGPGSTQKHVPGSLFPRTGCEPGGVHPLPTTISLRPPGPLDTEGLGLLQRGYTPSVGDVGGGVWRLAGIGPPPPPSKQL